ncbi:MAG: S-layer homology domain-containing protein [Paenibacillaceae bacterium]|nr:S-layer homology domain-containing protein [Paenibacillaceae bacterium]
MATMSKKVTAFILVMLMMIGSMPGLFTAGEGKANAADTNPAVTSVSISPSTASIAQGETKQLTPSVTVENGAAQTVTWTSSDSNTKVTVDANGLVSAAADAAPGDYTITATSTVDPSKTGTATITVKAAPPPAGYAQVLTKYKSIYNGNVIYENNLVTKYIYSDGTTLHETTTVPASAKWVTAASIFDEANASYSRETVYAYSDGDQIFSVSNPLTIPANARWATISEFKIAYQSPGTPDSVVPKIDGQQYNYSMDGVNALNGDSIPADAVWGTLASFKGMWSINTMQENFQNYELSAEVTSVSVSPTTASVVQGATRQLTATVIVVGGAAQMVTWTSSDSKVTVDANGLVTVAENAAPGNYTITATSTFNASKTGMATIAVTPPPSGDGGGGSPTPASPVTPPPSGGGGSGSPTPTSPVTSTDGTLTLPTDQAGEVSFENKVTISIPTGATSKELKLTIEKVLETAPLLTNKDVLASPVYEILKNFSENFNKPVTLTFAYDSTKLNGDQTVAVFYFDETKKEWVEVTGGAVNGGLITVEVNHFTKYAVFAVGKTAEVPKENNITLSDISGHWAEANIKKAVSGGIVEGYPDETFKPNHTVTRAEFAVMLMNALKPEGAGTELSFTDTTKIGSWAQKAVAQAVQAGVIKGYEDGSFRPNALISRTEMAAMIAHAMGHSTETNTATGFADDMAIPAWAKDSVAYVKQSGIMQGKGNNQFAPQDHATRAEAVTVLLKMLEQMSM